MRKRSIFGTFVALAATLALATSALAATNLIQNGGFEDGTLTGSFQQVTAGSSALSPWVVDVAVDWISSSYFTPAEGSRSIDMNASPSEGQIHQVFATTSGATYAVQFKLAGNPTVASSCPTAVKTLTATAGNATTDFEFDTTGYSATNMGWKDEMFTFVATGDTSTLTFTSTVAGNCGPAIDDVSVTQIVASGAECKDGGWATLQAYDSSTGTFITFKNQGACVSYFATNHQVPIGS